jgi:hypothetical protein
MDAAGIELQAVNRPRHQSSLKFFLRYPIFLLAFGPPVFKSAVGGDTSQAHFDIWNIVQVGWISLIALRAIVRLASAQSISIPRQARSILKYPILIGLLFLISVTYSPGRIISAEYTFLYFLSVICVIEFVSDAYRDPPDWMQCMFQLRQVALVLVAIVLVTLPIAPSLVMLQVQGAGIRLIGGSVAQMGFYPELIAIISAYTFLYSLESRTRSALFFLIGLACTLAVRSRGAEISLLIVLLALAIGWARMGRRSSYLLISGFVAVLLIAGVALAAVGPERIWNIFNRGQDLEGILTASGRTGVWADQIAYCVAHPQGMGYVAGVRTFRRSDYSTNLHAALTNIGGTDSSYMQVLVDGGWLGIAFYLIMMTKTIVLGRRFSRVRSPAPLAPAGLVYHPLRCALLVLMFCLIEGIETPVYVLPLWGPFYCQNLLIAIILGASGSAIIASRQLQSSAAFRYSR